MFRTLETLFFRKSEQDKNTIYLTIFNTNWISFTKEVKDLHLNTRIFWSSRLQNLLITLFYFNANPSKSNYYNDDYEANMFIDRLDILLCYECHK